MRQVKIAVVLARPVEDFLAVAGLLADKALPGCRLVLRVFRWDQDRRSLVGAVTTWAPDGILAMGELPGSLLAHWVGLPILGVAVPGAERTSTTNARIRALPLGPTQEDIRRIVVAGTAVSGRRIVYIEKRKSAGPAPAVGRQGHSVAGAGRTSAPSQSSGDRAKAAELYVLADRPDRLVAKLLNFPFRSGDLVVMGPSPDLFPEVVVRLLVSLQFVKGIVVVGFSRRHVLYGTALAIGSAPAAWSRALARSFAPLCGASKQRGHIQVFGPKHTWWYNPRVLSQLRDNNVVLRKAVGWIPLSGGLARSGAAHNVVRR